MFPVYRTSLASADIEEISNFIAQDNLAYSVKFADCVNQTLKFLSANPMAGKKEYMAGLFQEIRSFTVNEFRKYRIYYEFNGEKIRVARVLHTARNIPEIIEP